MQDVSVTIDPASSFSYCLVSRLSFPCIVSLLRYLHFLALLSVAENPFRSINQIAGKSTRDTKVRPLDRYSKVLNSELYSLLGSLVEAVVSDDLKAGFLDHAAKLSEIMFPRWMSDLRFCLSLLRTLESDNQWYVHL